MSLTQLSPLQPLYFCGTLQEKEMSHMNITVLDQKIRDYCRENCIHGVMRLTVKDQILYEASHLAARSAGTAVYR